MGILAEDELNRVLMAVEAAGLGFPERRRLLFEGIPPHYVARLPVFPEPRLQLFSDLFRLNRGTALPDGSVPLRIWLKNAICLVDDPGAAAALEKVLEKVSRQLGTPAASGSASPGGETGGAGAATTAGNPAVSARVPPPASRPRAGPAGPALLLPVFLSYVDGDRMWAEWMAARLEEAGYPVTLAAWDDVPGGNWMNRMNQALGHPDGIVLVVVSRHYLRSPSTGREWTTVLRRDPAGRRRLVVPVYVEAVEVPDLLGGVTPIRLSGLSADDAGRELLAGLAARAAGRRRPDRDPPFPPDAGLD